MDNRLKFLYFIITELWDTDREPEPEMEKPVQARYLDGRKNRHL